MELHVGFILVSLFFTLLVFRVPISFCLILSSLGGITYCLTPKFGIFVAAQKFVAVIDFFTLLEVHFFFLCCFLF